MTFLVKFVIILTKRLVKRRMAMTRTGGKETKEKILTIAEELFSEKGFDATSVDLIAQKAGVNKALIYYHYKSKQDLLNSLFKRTLDEMF